VKGLAGAALLLALAVLVALALGPANSSAAAAQPGAAAVAKASNPAKSKPARQRRLARLQARRAVSEIEPRALRRWPGSFGGLWLGRKGKIVIAFTRESKARAKLLARELPRGKRLRGIKVDNSLAALRKLQAQMIADRQLRPPLVRDPVTQQADRAGGRDDDRPPPPPPPPPPAPERLVPLVYDLYIDVKRNLVVAIVEQPVGPELAAVFAQRYGEDVLVEQGRLQEPASLIICQSRKECPPGLRSGMETIAQSGTTCSTAFNVTYQSGGKTLEGILSAAHCGNPDADLFDDRDHFNASYGKVVFEEQAGRVDAELHSVDGQYEGIAPWTANAPWIYIDNSERRAKVISAGTHNGLPVGAKVCKSGIKTEKTCGQVLAKTFSPSYVANSMDFVWTKFCSKSGDSGSGVYRPWGRRVKDGKPTYQAQGIVSGGSNAALPCDQKDSSIFGHIEFVFDALPVKVTTAAP
jgi:hypothetical protein